MNEQARGVEPVRQSVMVERSPEEAFRVFTDAMGSWWPLEGFSEGEKPVDVRLEPRVGGRLYEVGEDGSESDWGEIRAWDPPTRVMFSWHPGHAADRSTEVEVTFAPERSGTRVDLEHRGWEVYGEEAAEMRGEYVEGWEFVLSQYVEKANAA
jgi:uncharacterized protein YndB with AHSA1/START domain